MNIPLHDYFQILKQQVLYLAGIKNIAPADCYSLSLKIQKKTQKRISETTLKRIYGFAATRYNSSTYTRNTLAEFCGYESYSSYILLKEKEGLEKSGYKSWVTILENAHKNSRFRIRSNKHRSGIPYNLAIRRSKMEKIIHEFSLGSSTACIITAPVGGGKTIGLTKWVDRCINGKSIEEKKDIYLFIETPNLLISSIYNFHAIHWLSYLIDLKNGDNLYDFLNNHRTSAPGNFYLVIDDIPNSSITEKEYRTIFTVLIDMVNYFSSFNWFKIILSIRPYIWRQNKHLVETNNEIRKQWCINAHEIKGFDQEEIEKLNYNLNLEKHTDLPYSQSLLSIIQLPLYFQLYYQLKKNPRQSKNQDTFEKFNILRAHLNKHILNGIYLNKKLILLDELSKFLIYKKDTLSIEVSKAIPIYNQFSKAYEELINSGIIYPFSEDVGLRRINEIRFESKTLGSYFLALRFLKKNDNIFDKNLIQHINRSHYQESIKINLLYWLIIVALEGSNVEFLNNLSNVNFIQLNETNVILFAIDCIENILPERAIQEFYDNKLNISFFDFALQHLPEHSKQYSFFNSVLNYKMN